MVKVDTIHTPQPLQDPMQTQWSVNGCPATSSTNDIGDAFRPHRRRALTPRELDLHGNSVSPNKVNTATCLFTGWLEDRSIGLQQATVNTGPTEAAPFSLILGAQLQPGLYKLRLWATCSAPWVRNLRVSVALFEKTPADLNLRPVTADDLAHRQR